MEPFSTHSTKSHEEHRVPCSFPPQRSLTQPLDLKHLFFCFLLPSPSHLFPNAGATQYDTCPPKFHLQLSKLEFDQDTVTSSCKNRHVISTEYKWLISPISFSPAQLHFGSAALQQQGKIRAVLLKSETRVLPKHPGR